MFLYVGLKNTGQTLIAERLQIPPIHIWKSFGPEVDETSFELHLAQEDIYRVSFGTVYNPNSFGRAFLSFKLVKGNNWRFALGVDVDCDLVQGFTTAKTHHLLTDGKSVLCRVEVLNASLAVSPPRNWPFGHAQMLKSRQNIPE
jgi:hypothetical protein